MHLMSHRFVGGSSSTHSGWTKDASLLGLVVRNGSNDDEKGSVYNPKLDADGCAVP